MCGTCGCGGGAHEATTDAGSNAHGRAHAHAHDSDAAARARRVAVERSLLEENAARAEALRKRLAARGIEAIGLVGGPGAGKTTLLEATFARLGEAARREAVIEGDCATDLDARRIAACGVPVAQVATGTLCHLDAHGVEHALDGLDLAGVDRIWIENVGNLVCPAPFACGETRRALLVSVAEGDDKPAKYPALVAACDLLVVTKIDLLPHVDFDPDRCAEHARRVRPGMPVLALSARTGEGLDAWLRWAHEGRA